MSDTINSARLHERAGRVAIRLGEQPTVYISTELAAKLAEELKLAAAQIKNANHYPTTEIGE